MLDALRTVKRDVDGLEEIRFPDGFDQIAAQPHVVRAGDIVSPMVRGQHHYRRALGRAGSSDLFGSLESIHLRHATIEEQELVGLCRSSSAPPFSESLTTGCSIRHLCSQGSQGFAKD